MSRAWPALLCALAAGCAPALVHPTADDARRSGIALAELERGRGLYVARCASCHALHLPSEIPAARWPQLLDGMAPRAKISRTERDAIERYLLAAAGRDPD